MRFRISASSVVLEIDDESPPDSVPPPRERARAKRLPLRVIDTEGAEVIELEEVRRHG